MVTASCLSLRTNCYMSFKVSTIFLECTLKEGSAWTVLTCFGCMGLLTIVETSLETSSLRFNVVRNNEKITEFLCKCLYFEARSN